MSPPVVLTAEQVAERLTLKRSTVLDMARQGRIPSIRLGRHVRFVEADVNDFVLSLRGEQADDESVDARAGA